MRLEADEAVDHVHARLLQCARPLDVGLFVEARLDLDERDDLLAGLGGVDERVDDRGVAGRAVQRLLDRQHVRVGGGLLDEALHARGERVVRVVHQHVAVAQRREDALGCLAFAERRRGGGHERRVLELGPVDAVDLPQRRQVEQPGHLDDVAGVDVELAQQQLEHVLGHVVGDLEAHRRAEPAAGQLAFQRLQQVLVAVLLDLEVGVAGDPEGVVLDDLHAGEQHRQERRDQLLHRQERATPPGPSRGPSSTKRSTLSGTLTRAKCCAAVVGLLDGDRQVQAQPADEGERVRRVDGQRRQHREHLLVEVGRQPRRVRRRRVRPSDDRDALVGQRGPDRVEEHLRVPAGDLLGALADPAQLFARRQAVRRAHGQPHLVAALETGDAHHVELVEVGGEDRQELGALQQRQRRCPRPAPAPGS